MKQLEAEAGEDARTLARLWQLQNKMESVGSGASYGEKLPGLSSPDSHLFEKAAAVLLADPGLPHPAPNDFSLCEASVIASVRTMPGHAQAHVKHRLRNFIALTDLLPL